MIINHYIDDLLYEVIDGEKEDLLIRYGDVQYQITSSENQNYKNYTKISSIKLGDCEKILKQKYNISKNTSLIIFKIDYYIKGISIPLIGYEIFHPITKEQLNLSYCHEKLINLDIPVEINEDIFFKYDPNSKYYNDECNTYTTENGTDIILNDRKDEFVKNNMSLCQNNCSFNSYEKDSKMAICKCQIKSKIFLISEMAQETNILDNNIINTKKKSLGSSMDSMKCIDTLFTKEGLEKNISNYVLMFLFFAFSILGILFYKIGYFTLCDQIHEIEISKKKKRKKKKEEKQGNRPLKKKKGKKINNPIKKSSKNNFIYNTTKKDSHKSFKISNSNSKSSYFLKLINHKNTSKSLNILQTNIIPVKEKKLVTVENEFKDLNDYELNSLSYKNALKIDKRTFCQYYISLLKVKHPIIFSFCPINDFNSIIVKISMFILAFSIYYGINGLFFNEEMIHKIYEEWGVYNFILLLPSILYSFIISHTLCNVIKYIFLTERNILVIKSQKTLIKAQNKEEEVTKRIIIKNIAYFVIGVILIIFFWFKLSTFGAVYQNTQILLFENTLICFGFSFIYPFFINLITAIIRIYSLRSKSKKNVILYKVSRIMQFI